jgi:hypothetical protein
VPRDPREKISPVVRASSADNAQSKDSVKKIATCFDRRNNLVDNGWLPVLDTLGLLPTWDALDRHADKTGITFVGPEKIASLIGRSVRSVIRYRKQLVALGLLERTRAPSPGVCAEWRLLTPPRTPPVCHTKEVFTDATVGVMRTSDKNGGARVTPNGVTHDTDGGSLVTPACHHEQRNSNEQHQQTDADADFLTKPWDEGGCGIDPSAIGSIPKGFSSSDLALIRQKVNAESGIRNRPARMMGLLKLGPESRDMQALRKRENVAAGNNQALPAARRPLPYGSSPLAYETREQNEARLNHAQEISRQRMGMSAAITVQSTPTPEKNSATRCTEVTEKYAADTQRWFAGLTQDQKIAVMNEIGPPQFLGWSGEGEIPRSLILKFTQARLRLENHPAAAEAAPERSEDAA